MKKIHNYGHYPSVKWRNILILVKIKLSLLILCTGGLSASPLSPQQTTLDISYRNTPLSSVLSDLKTRTGYNFTYDREVVNESIAITAQMKNATLVQILDRILIPHGYSYEIDRKIVYIRGSKMTTVQNQRPAPTELTGVVEDSEGHPIAGVSVVVKGTSIGAATDSEGRYSIWLSRTANTIIVFSFIGKRRSEFYFDGQSELNVTLENEVMQMADVVVTGIFTKARESYTGAVSTITAKELDMYRGQNLVSTLRNIDPSINMVLNNEVGSNPNSIPLINIRGNSSLPMSVKEVNEGVTQRVNNPLIIMDGFEISITRLMDYNDDEIESINILKDAAATAIYGSRGSNGVIVVISKPPQPGKLKISFQAGLNLEIPDLTSYSLLNAAEKLELEELAGLYTSTDASPHLAYRDLYARRLKAVREGVNTDWLGKPLRVGVGQKYNLRLEGGSDEFRWGTTFSYNKIQGAMRGSDRQTFNGGVILSYTYKRLIFKNQTNIGWNRARESNYGKFSDYAKMQPYYNPMDENGKPLKSLPDFYETQQEKNPLYDATLNTLNQSKYVELINNFSIEWNIIDNLRLRAQLGISRTDTSSDLFYPAEHSKFLADEYLTEEGYARRGSYDYTDGENFNYDANVTLSYTATIDDLHQIYAGFDYSIAQADGYIYKFSAEGFGDGELDFIPNARQYALDQTPGGDESKTRRVGFTGNVNYTYDDRYFADFSIRMDGSSQFGARKKFAPFWSVGVGWNLHRENFMDDSKIINSLRLKASAGQTGSQQFSAYQALSTYKYYTDTAYGYWTAAKLMALGNPDLKWQTTTEYNVGTEFYILSRRITGSFDYYVKRTTNLLSSKDVVLATGFDSYVANIGEVENKGFEAGLLGYPIRDYQRQLLWMISGKLAYNKNRITKLSDAVKQQTEEALLQDVNINRLFYEGRSQNALYAVRSLGIDPSSGKELFLDRYGNLTETWSPSAKVYMGDGEPLYRGNVNTMVVWRNLTLNLSFAYHWGGMLYNETLLDKVEVTYDQIRSGNVDSRVLKERWTKDGDKVFFKGFSNDATRMTSRFVMKDKVFEFQSANLQYRFDSERLRQSNIRQIVLGVNMSDIFYVSSVKRERGTNYPFARRMGMSVSVLF